MLKLILSGYAKILRTIIIFAALLAVCVAAGSAVVWPLWKLANADPSLYTALICLLIAAAVAFFAYKRGRKAFRADPRKFLIRLASIAVLLAGAIGSIALVLAWHRALAGTVVLATIAAYGILAFGFGSSRRPARA